MVHLPPPPPAFFAEIPAERALGASSIARTGLLPNDPFWRYVEARFDLAESEGASARFQHYHPFITPWLIENRANLDRLNHPAPVAMPSLPAPPPVAGPPSTPIPPSTPVGSYPASAGSQGAASPPVYSPSVPEPKSIVSLVTGGFLIGLWASLRRK